MTTLPSCDVTHWFLVQNGLRIYWKGASLIRIYDHNSKYTNDHELYTEGADG